jgi:hypothetical protein
MRNLAEVTERRGTTILDGVRYTCGPHECMQGSIQIAGERIARILHDRSRSESSCQGVEIDLSGFLVMPGFINAHDHLHFALYPRLGNPPYQSYIDWGEEIHARLGGVINIYKSIPKQVRLWWGGIRNLLCGVTTVCHHDPLWPELQQKEFPVKVVQRYGWAHSLALGGDLREARSGTPEGAPFIVHACEGVDELARLEVFGLDRLGVLDADTVLVHALAIDDAGLALVRERRAGLIVCPSSNQFLFGKLPHSKLVNELENTSLGSDSSITAIGDLLDEVRFAIDHCGVVPEKAYGMVTEAPASSLRLREGEGAIRRAGRADLIAVRDNGDDAAARLRTLSMADIELVLLAGQVQLASDEVYGLLPLQVRQGMECLWVDGNIRWLRAPVRLLMREVEAVLGHNNARLGGKQLRILGTEECHMPTATRNGPERSDPLFL